MITPSVFWFLLCLQNFPKSFWSNSLIRTITENEKTKEIFKVDQEHKRDFTKVKEKRAEREKIETLMLWDLKILKKFPLLTNTDFKSLGKFYRYLKRHKRVGRKFLFGTGVMAGQYPAPIEISESHFSDCNTLQEKQQQVSQVYKNFKQKNSSRDLDKETIFNFQTNVLKSRNQLYHFFKDRIKNTAKKKENEIPLRVELKKSENNLLVLTNKPIQAKKKSENCDLMERVRVTPMDTLLRALETMRKENFQKIFNSVDRIRSRIQETFRSSRILIENYKESTKTSSSRELLQDMRTLCKEEQQYLIYKEKKQKIRKLQDVHHYRQVLSLTLNKLKKPRTPNNPQEPTASNPQGKVQPTDSICQVCTSGDYSETNQIVFCSKCNVSVHQLCYGLAEVPEEDWVCQVCLVFGARGRYLDCALCSCRGGAMKEVNVTVFDDFVKRNLPVYWRRQQDKIDKFRKKMSFDFKLENNAKMIESKEMVIQQNEGDKKEENMSLQVNGLVNSTDIQIINKVVDSYKWDVNTHTGSFFDFYKEKFNFTREEIQENEPLSQKCWIHLSCGLWMPEIFLKDKAQAPIVRNARERKKAKKRPMIRKKKKRLVEIACEKPEKKQIIDLRKHLNTINIEKYQLTGLKDIDQSMFGWECGACSMRGGTCLKCHSEDCNQRFHIECAKRAGLTIESQNSEHKDYIIFCETHTPLKFKKEIELTQKKSRNEIIKFSKNMKKQLKEVVPREELINMSKVSFCNEDRHFKPIVNSFPEPQPPKIKIRENKIEKKKKLKKKKEKKEKREKKEKYTLEEKIATLSPENKQFLLDIKNELETNKDFFFVWDVNLGEVPKEEGLIHESLRVSLPKKNIYTNKILKSNQIWKSLSKAKSKSIRYLYEKHLSIVNSIKVSKFKRK